MPKVKIKHKHSKDGKNKILLLQILAENHIYATRIPTTFDGFIVLTRTDEDIEKILSKELSIKLKSKSFLPVIPPELKAKRTVIMTRLDDYIYKNTLDVLTEELIANNEWISEDDIEEIYKFPRSNTMKVTFQQMAHAKKA